MALVESGFQRPHMSQEIPVGLLAVMSNCFSRAAHEITKLVSKSPGVWIGGGAGGGVEVHELAI